jgi:hypothetical protein
MAERVIFEYRAGGRRGKRRFDFEHGGFVSAFHSSIRACFQPGEETGQRFQEKVVRFSRRRRKARRRVRKTLEFFERLYDDLYGSDEDG